MLSKSLLLFPIVPKQMQQLPKFECPGKLEHCVSQPILSFFQYMDRHYNQLLMVSFFSLRNHLDNRQLFIQVDHLGRQTMALQYQYSFHHKIAE